MAAVSGRPHAHLWQHGDAARRAAEWAFVIVAVLAGAVAVATDRMLAGPAARWRAGVRVGCGEQVRISLKADRAIRVPRWGARRGRRSRSIACR